MSFRTLIIFATFLFCAQLVLAEAKVSPFSGKLTSLTTPHGTITWKYVDDEKLQQTIGGSGGSVFRITIENTHLNTPHNGTQISFIVVAISGALNGFENGMPIFEIWGRAGGGSYGKGTMKFLNGRYETTTASLYTVFKPTPNSLPDTYFPGDHKKEQPLYFEKVTISKSGEQATAPNR